MKKISLISGIVLLVLIAIVYNRTTSDSSSKKALAKKHSTPQELYESDSNSSHEADSNHVVARATKNPKREQAKKEQEDIKQREKALSDYLKQREKELNESKITWSPDDTSPDDTTESFSYDPNTISKSKAELRELSQAFEPDIRSATISAEINTGETLVTGGYQAPNGDYEFHFLTPMSIDNIGNPKLDGSMFKLTSKIISLRAESVKDLGLDGLITEIRKTSQHSEVWTQDTLNQALANITEIEGAESVTLPYILSSASKSVAIQMGGPNGYISIEGILDRGSNGGILIRSTVETYEKAN